ncbi:MAG TPA: hypothetical protein VHO28_15990, partial [Ignavibacteriales bacterium]|nr:hypothetical protein [Ignavibacteriales bacterium]
ELNIANVIQEKLNGYETIPGGSETIISQIGEENSAEITQISASYNYGEINQFGNRNSGVIAQGDGEWYNSSNQAKIFQYGNDNYGYINEGDLGNIAEIIQKGNSNKAILEMYNAIIHPASNYGYIYQEGNKNYAKQFMGDAGVDGKIEQKGNYNIATQGLSASPNINGAYGEIKQYQNNAEAYQSVSALEGYGYINQTSSNPAASNYNKQIVYSGASAIANVYGDDNYGYQKVGSTYSFSVIEERGNNNSTTTLLAETCFTNILTAEGSSFNIVMIDQTLGSIWSSYGHSASIYIDGSYNNAAILQVGEINNAAKTGSYGIEITGDYNIAEIYQNGKYNTADLHLFGDNIETNIEQVGNNMTTSITQEN